MAKYRKLGSGQGSGRSALTQTFGLKNLFKAIENPLTADCLLVKSLLVLAKGKNIYVVWT